MMHSDLQSHVAHRRAQLAELRVMACANHYGAAEACDRIERELADLGHPVERQEAAKADDQVVDQPATPAEAAAAAAPASSADHDAPADPADLVDHASRGMPAGIGVEAAAKPRRSRAKAKKRAKGSRR